MADKCSTDGPGKPDNHVGKATSKQGSVSQAASHSSSTHESVNGDCVSIICAVARATIVPYVLISLAEAPKNDNEILGMNPQAPLSSM